MLDGGDDILHKIGVIRIVEEEKEEAKNNFDRAGLLLREHPIPSFEGNLLVRPVIVRDDDNLLEMIGLSKKITKGLNDVYRDLMNTAGIIILFIFYYEKEGCQILK